MKHMETDRSCANSVLNAIELFLPKYFTIWASELVQIWKMRFDHPDET